jgi:hypothetical protein
MTMRGFIHCGGTGRPWVAARRPRTRRARTCVNTKVSTLVSTASWCSPSAVPELMEVEVRTLGCSVSRNDIGRDGSDDRALVDDHELVPDQDGEKGFYGRYGQTETFGETPFIERRRRVEGSENRVEGDGPSLDTTAVVPPLGDPFGVGWKTDGRHPTGVDDAGFEQVGLSVCGHRAGSSRGGYLGETVMGCGPSSPCGTTLLLSVVVGSNSGHRKQSLQVIGAGAITEVLDDGVFHPQSLESRESF